MRGDGSFLADKQNTENIFLRNKLMAVSFQNSILFLEICH